MNESKNQPESGLSSGTPTTGSTAFPPTGRPMPETPTAGTMQRLQTSPERFGDTGPQPMQKILSNVTGLEHGKTGLTEQTARESIEYQRRPVIKDRAAFLTVKSLLSRLNRPPQFRWIEGPNGMRKEQVNLPAPLTPEEQGLMAELSKPCGREIVALHVARLAAHKRLNDDASAASVVVRDFTDYLFAERLNEYQLYNVMDFFIAKQRSPFFPPLSEVMAAAEICRAKGYVDKLPKPD